ncbi:hypothetical protein ACF1GW_29455 [Streptomyces achromogenes]
MPDGTPTDTRRPRHSGLPTAAGFHSAAADHTHDVFGRPNPTDSARSART